jgi:hypothetical protein
VNSHVGRLNRKIRHNAKESNYYLAAMSEMQHLTDFVLPVSLAAISEDQGFRAGQMGKQILVYEEDAFPELDTVDLVLVGCGEQRGLGMGRPFCKGTDQIRKIFYRSFYWHTEIRIADIGNIKPGASLSDTYAALNLVIRELTDAGKRVLIIGGSHDLTQAAAH